MDTSHARPSVIFLSPIGTFSRKPPIIVSEKKLGRQRISSDGTLRYVSEWGVLFDKRSLFPNLMRFMRRSRSGLLLSIIEVYHLLPNHYPKLREEVFSQAEASFVTVGAATSTGLVSSRSMTNVISSLATRPPPANTMFQFRPQSLRFTLPRRLKPAL